MKTNNAAWQARAVRARAVAGHWLRALWPMVVVVVAGATVFWQSVVDSILSTPHPGLVYTIFGVLTSAVLLAALALGRYVREESLALRLRQAEPAQRLALLEQTRWTSDLLPLYRAALAAEPTTQRHVLEQKLEAELFAGEEHLFSRLTLPNYLGGALVGIGLVGTFVGLLGSLADLGSLFASLMNAGNTSADPVAMFSDMLRRLQEPMKGMGTAFVASLYGLMGSLVMGLVNYSVRKSGAQVLGRVRDLLRTLAAERQGQAGAETPWSEAAWEQLFAAMNVERRTLSHSLAEFMGVLRAQTDVLEGVRSQAAEAQQQNAHLSASLQAFDTMGERLLTGQEHLVAHLLAADRAQRQGVDEMVQAIGKLHRPPAQWLMVGGLWLIAACAVVAVASTLMTYRLNQQVLARLDSSARVQSPPAPIVPPSTPGYDAPATQPQAAGAVNPPAPELPSVLVVQEGDVLSRIAERHGVSLEALRAANPDLKDPDRLQVGQTLHLP